MKETREELIKKIKENSKKNPEYRKMILERAKKALNSKK